MTIETFKKAQELTSKINYSKQIISMLDTMLNHWYDPDRADITVNYRGGQHDPGLCMHHTELPELRDALMKARDRYKFDLRKLEDELAAL